MHTMSSVCNLCAFVFTGEKWRGEKERRNLIHFIADLVILTFTVLVN